jgi:tetratricopeptide (TPR) repeat protein
MDFNQFPPSRPSRDHDRSSRVVMMGLATAIIASVLQIASWDKYALDIIPYQAREAVGATGPQDWEQVAKMCWELKKWDCVEAEYTKAAQSDPQLYPRLGHYLIRRLKWDKAVTAFRVYINNGGEDLEATAAYAKALGETDQLEDATKYFTKVLESQNELQIPVILNFVKVLVKDQKYAMALKLIEDVRHKNPAGSQFMEAEYNQIKNLKTASR